jgi:Uma2 family endonuclease
MTAENVLALPKVHYPDSDGMPMAESDFQRKPLTYAIEALSIHFLNQPDVYVSGDLFVYYDEGNPEAVVAPDVFVVFGVPKRERRIYQVWKEGKAPDFVLEITSKSTRTKDQGPKRGTYAYLGVREYFLFDPTTDYLVPPLLGARLEDSSYEPIPAQRLPDGSLSLYSQVLGLELRLDASNKQLRFFDPATKNLLRSHAEAEAAFQLEAAARHAAEERAQTAEAELERLRAELARLRGETGTEAK